MKKSFYLQAALLLLAASAATADDAPLTSLPKSPAWEHGRSFVAVFNRGERAALTNYLQQHLSEHATRHETLDQRVNELLRQQRELGTLEVVEVSGVSHAAVVNLRGAQADADADIIVVVSAQNPAKLDQLILVRNPHERLVAGRVWP